MFSPCTQYGNISVHLRFSLKVLFDLFDLDTDHHNVQGGLIMCYRLMYDCLDLMQCNFNHVTLLNKFLYNVSISKKLGITQSLNSIQINSSFMFVQWDQSQVKCGKFNFLYNQVK